MALSGFAQGPYAPAAGHLGSLAMHKDSTAFIEWASEISVLRGKKDIAQINSDTVTVGAWSAALGKAEGSSVVSLGDGGIAIVRFSASLFNGIGPDFAIFENSFNNTFLELAFVEVSSDGLNYFRFPSVSLTDTTTPVGSFGAIDPRNIHNLAGKYRANYGTPFDLEELKDIVGLDVQNVTHIRIVDVVGTLNDSLAKRDHQGRKINDQYPTAFPSGGFDLDAVGAVYLRPVGIIEQSIQTLKMYPNPAQSYVAISGKEWENKHFSIQHIKGTKVRRGILNQQRIDLEGLASGIYIIELRGESTIGRSKLIIQ